MRVRGAGVFAVNSIKPGIVVDGRYKILSTLGQGGMGTVFCAEESELNRVVALKLLHSGIQDDADTLNRFVREGQVLCALNHQNIVAVYRCGLWQDCRYIVMEMLQGQSLRNVLDRESKLEWRRAVKIVQQICAGMQNAHNQGILHRDLSPNNIMLLSKPEPDFVKVVDFGLAKVVAGSSLEVQKLTQTGALVGSVYYMSPEQALGQQLDHRADIYSLGCIMYEMLTGAPPLVADNPIGLIHKHVHERPSSFKKELREMIPDGLETIVFKAMDKSADSRYQTMELLADELAKLLSVDANAAPLKRISAEQKRKRLRMSVAVTTALVAAAFVISAFLDPGLAVPVSFILSNNRSEQNFDWTEQTAQFFRNNNHYRGALMLYLDALKICEDPVRGAKVTEARVIRLKARIAQCYQSLGEYELARTWAQKALAQLMKLTFKRRTILPDHGLLHEGVQASLGVLAEQHYFPQNSERIVDAIDPYMGATRSVETSLLLRMFQMNYYAKANPMRSIRTYLPIGIALRESGRHKESIEWLDKCINAKTDSEHPWRRHDLMECYLDKAYALKKLGLTNQIPAVVKQAQETYDKGHLTQEPRYEVDVMIEFADLLITYKIDLPKATEVMTELREKSKLRWEDPLWAAQRVRYLKLRQKLEKLTAEGSKQGESAE